MAQTILSKSAAEKRLRSMQFRRYESCRETVQAFYALRKSIDALHFAPEIWKLYQWLLCPLTLWALDYVGIAQHVLAEIRAKQDLDADTLLLLKLLDAPPSIFAQNQIGEYEKTVAQGLYDHLTRQPEKFAETELKRKGDLALVKAWNQIKSRFRLKAYQSARGVVRRTLCRERNFEAHRKFKWRSKRDRFHVIFDALCYKWCLYGFEHDKPLLLKVSVNPTPYGTMILVPKHMSLDGSRDLDWPAIGRIHRAHGAARQGPALSAIRIARHAQRQDARVLDQEAKRQKLRGTSRYEFILEGMGQPLHRISWVRRLLRMT